MTRNRIVTSVLLSAGVLLVSACATPPGTVSLDERYFQREVRNFTKVERDGKTLYCVNDSSTASLIPTKRCLTETALRRRVEDWRRTRNAVERPMHATVGSIGG